MLRDLEAEGMLREALPFFSRNDRRREPAVITKLAHLLSWQGRADEAEELTAQAASLVEMMEQDEDSAASTDYNDDGTGDELEEA